MCFLNHITLLSFNWREGDMSQRRRYKSGKCPMSCGLYRVTRQMRCVTIKTVISLHVALQQISLLMPLTACAYINGIGLG